MHSGYPDSNKSLDQKPPVFILQCNKRRQALSSVICHHANLDEEILNSWRSLWAHSTTHGNWDLPACLWPPRYILLSSALKQVRERTAHTSIEHSFHLKTSNIKLLTGVSLLSPEASLFYKLHYYGAIKRFNDLNSALDLRQMLSLSTKYQTYRLQTQTWEILSEIF